MTMPSPKRQKMDLPQSDDTPRKAPACPGPFSFPVRGICSVGQMPRNDGDREVKE